MSGGRGSDGNDEAVPPLSTLTGSWPGSSTMAEVPVGTTTSTVSSGPSRRQPMDARPYGVSWAADAPVKPPPGTYGRNRMLR